MKIAWFKRAVSPEVGCFLSGYSANDVSVAKTDDLFVTGFCADDGERKILIVSFDVNGLDEWYSKRIRKSCAEILGVDPSAVLFSCTHNHSGPETRSMRKAPDHLNTDYLEKLENVILEEVKNLSNFRECNVYFYSSKCDENRNRRYTTACNNATFTPHRREVVPIATEYADKELGELCFIDTETHLPIYVIGNYAALVDMLRPAFEETLNVAFNADVVPYETATEVVYVFTVYGDLYHVALEGACELVIEIRVPKA